MSKVRTFTGAPKAVASFIKEAKDELKKVTWPTRETAVRYTVVVVISSIIVGLIIGGVDYVFALAIERLI